MKIIDIKDLNLDYFAEQKFKLFDSAWCGILPDSWLNKFTVQSVKTDLEKNLKSGHKIYLATLDDDTPCGYIMFGKFRDKDNSDDGEIMSIYFYEQFKGLGLAQELFNYAQNELEKQYKTIYIWVLEINKRARTFYEKNGYKDTGKRRFQDCDKLYEEMLYSKNV